MKQLLKKLTILFSLIMVLTLSAVPTLPTPVPQGTEVPAPEPGGNGGDLS